VTTPRFIADENFNGRLLRALCRRCREFDVIRVVDAGRGGERDPEILEWAATLGRIVLSHDIRTMTADVRDRIAAGKPMPGLIIVAAARPSHVVIEDLLAIAGASRAEEYADQIVHIPFDRTTHVAEPEPYEWGRLRETVSSPAS